MPPNGRYGSSTAVGAGGDHHLLRADDLRADLGLDLDRLAVAKSGPALDRSSRRPSSTAPETPLLRRPTMPSFQRMVLARSSAGLPAEMPSAALAGGNPRSLLEFVGGVDQRLGGNAADIEAGAAGLFRLDHHGVDAKLAGPDRADIAAGPAPITRSLAGDVLHGAHPSIKISAGVSSSALMRCTNTAAS